MFKFIRKNREGTTNIFKVLDETWPEIVYNFLLFLKGCGFHITKDEFESYIDYFDSMGAFSESNDRLEKVEELSELTGLTPTFINNVLLQKEYYKKNTDKLEEIELDIEEDTLNLIKEKAEELNVSFDVIISALLRTYLDNEKP